MENKENPRSPWIGPFYYAPKDSRLTVPRAIGTGWTLNFGNPVARGLFALILFVLLCICYLKLR